MNALTWTGLCRKKIQEQLEASGLQVDVGSLIPAVVDYMACRKRDCFMYPPESSDCGLLMATIQAFMLEEVATFHVRIYHEATVNCVRVEHSGRKWCAVRAPSSLHPCLMPQPGSQDTHPVWSPASGMRCRWATAAS